MPRSPAPRKPAASPPSRPGRPKKPGEDAGAAPVIGRAGCVTVRWTGAAVVGAVRVAGGAEKVRVPRLPALAPPPARASASVASRPHVSATARTAIAMRKREPIMKTSQRIEGASCDHYWHNILVFCGDLERGLGVAAQVLGRAAIFAVAQGGSTAC